MLRATRTRVTGYNVLVDGAKSVVGGTSAVAPLYAGLFAVDQRTLVKQGKPRAGDVHRALTQNPQASVILPLGTMAHFPPLQVGMQLLAWEAPNGIQIADAADWLTDAESLEARWSWESAAGIYNSEARI